MIGRLFRAVQTHRVARTGQALGDVSSKSRDLVDLLPEEYREKARDALAYADVIASTLDPVGTGISNAKEAGRAAIEAAVEGRNVKLAVLEAVAANGSGLPQERAFAALRTEAFTHDNADAVAAVDRISADPTGAVRLQLNLEKSAEAEAKRVEQERLDAQQRAREEAAGQSLPRDDRTPGADAPAEADRQAQHARSLTVEQADAADRAAEDDLSNQELEHRRLEQEQRASVPGEREPAPVSHAGDAPATIEQQEGYGRSLTQDQAEAEGPTHDERIELDRQHQHEIKGEVERAGAADQPNTSQPDGGPISSASQPDSAGDDLGEDYGYDVAA